MLNYFNFAKIRLRRQERFSDLALSLLYGEMDQQVAARFENDRLQSKTPLFICFDKKSNVLIRFANKYKRYPTETIESLPKKQTTRKQRAQWQDFSQ